MASINKALSAFEAAEYALSQINLEKATALLQSGAERWYSEKGFVEDTVNPDFKRLDSLDSPIYSETLGQWASVYFSPAGVFQAVALVNGISEFYFQTWEECDSFILHTFVRDTTGRKLIELGLALIQTKVRFK
jgi:hypothetical protein